MSAGTESKPEWENPWSTDDIRKHSNNWSLAGDSGLCNRLQLFSETLILKSDDVQKNLDSLIRETKAVNSRISNAVNEFLMLSNTQFVENRVYDEEIIDEIANDEKKSDEVEKSKEQKELEVLPRITTALQLGLKVIDEHFEKHETIESEGEKEDGSSTFQLPVLEPKDIYLSRPLPFIIGSEKFMLNDRVGLLDDFSEDEKSEQNDVTVLEEQALPDKSSESPLKHEIDNELEPEYNEVSKPFYPKDSLENENLETHTSDTDDFFIADSSSDYNDSEGEHKETLFPNQKQPLTKASDSFASELAAKLGISSPVQEQPVNKKDEKNIPKVKKEDQDEFFVNSYEDDEDIAFSKTKGLFSGGGRLFDDIDDDEDLFSEITKNDGISNDVGKGFKGHKKMSPKAASHSSSTIDENSQNMSPASLQTKRPAAKSKSSLFDDDDDEDQDNSDLFSTQTKSSVQTPKRKEKVDLFDDTLSGSPTSLFDDISVNKAKQSTSAETTPKKSIPVGAVSLFGNAVNPMMNALKSRSSFIENEVNNEISHKEKERPGDDSRKSSVSSQTLQTKSKVDSKKSVTTDNFSGNETDLFNDATNDLIFPETSSKKHEKKRPSRVSSISLFDDDSDDSDVLFNTPSTKLEDKTNSTTSEKISQKGTLSNATSKNGQKSSSDLDGKEAKDIFSKITTSSRKGTVSLFDDDDNESDDIFSVSSMKEDQSLPVGKSKSIFAKEDDLFAESFDDSPNIDIFKNDIYTADTPEPKKNAVPSIASTDQLSHRIDLFNEVDDDIFASKVKEPKAIGKPPIPTPRKASLPKEDVKFIDSSEAAIPVKKEDSPIRKPIGGVALFQGIDPFAGKMKGDGKELSNKLEKAARSETDVVSDTKVPILVSEVPSSAKETLLKTKVYEEAAISFEEPVAVDLLHNVVKERAKVQVKRRPPSRKNRQDNARKSNVAMQEDAKDLSEGMENDGLGVILAKENLIRSPSSGEADGLVANSSANSVSSKLDTLNTNGGLVTSPSTEEDDLFSLTDQVAPVLVSRIDSVPRKDISVTYPSESEDFDEDNDIFMHKNSKVELSNSLNVEHKTPTGNTQEKVKGSREKADDGLFNSSASRLIMNSKENDIFVDHRITNSPNNKSKVTKSLFDDDDSDSDDLFADTSLKKDTMHHNSVGSSTKSSLSRTDKSKAQHSLFGDSDDNDDLNIFCDSLSTKK